MKLSDQEIRLVREILSHQKKITGGPWSLTTDIPAGIAIHPVPRILTLDDVYKYDMCYNSSTIVRRMCDFKEGELEDCLRVRAVMTALATGDGAKSHPKHQLMFYLNRLGEIKGGYVTDAAPAGLDQVLPYSTIIASPPRSIGQLGDVLTLPPDDDALGQTDDLDILRLLNINWFAHFHMTPALDGALHLVPDAPPTEPIHEGQQYIHLKGDLRNDPPYNAQTNPTGHTGPISPIGMESGRWRPCLWVPKGILFGPLGERPIATSVITYTVWVDTDTGNVAYSNGAIWIELPWTGGGGGTYTSDIGKILWFEQPLYNFPTIRAASGTNKMTAVFPTGVHTGLRGEIPYKQPTPTTPMNLNIYYSVPYHAGGAKTVRFVIKWRVINTGDLTSSPQYSGAWDCTVNPLVTDTEACRYLWTGWGFTASLLADKNLLVIDEFYRDGDAAADTWDYDVLIWGWHPTWNDAYAPETPDALNIVIPPSQLHLKTTYAGRPDPDTLQVGTLVSTSDTGETFLVDTGSPHTYQKIAVADGIPSGMGILAQDRSPKTGYTFKTNFVQYTFCQTPATHTESLSIRSSVAAFQMRADPDEQGGILLFGGCGGWLPNLTCPDDVWYGIPDTNSVTGCTWAKKTPMPHKEGELPGRFAFAYGSTKLWNGDYYEFTGYYAGGLDEDYTAMASAFKCTMSPLGVLSWDHNISPLPFSGPCVGGVIADGAGIEYFVVLGQTGQCYYWSGSSWVSISDAPSKAFPAHFTIDGSWYVVTGSDSQETWRCAWSVIKTAFEWVQMADFIGMGRSYAAGYGNETDGYGVVGMGYSDGLDFALADCYKYHPDGDYWESIAPPTTIGISNSCGVSANMYDATGVIQKTESFFMCGDNFAEGSRFNLVLKENLEVIFKKD